MADTRTIWKNSFKEDEVPEWTCPTCTKGSLIGKKENLHVIENVTSLLEHGLDEWEPEWIRGHFHGILTCSNPACGEKVVITGRMSTSEEPDYDEEFSGFGYGFRYVQYLTPKYFLPALKIINVHKEVPQNITNAINNSFSLFWLDTASCANKIRSVVEIIMDEQGVQKNFNLGGKRKTYTLHKRIELFKVKKTDEAELLMAIKWIGNVGSHVGEELTKDDLLDAYEILEHVTAKLYETTTKRIKQMSKTINKKKKPMGTKRSSKIK